MIRTFLLFVSLSLLPSAVAQTGSFEDWRSGFMARMASEGVSEEIIMSMMDGLEPDDRIIDRDRSQPEFVRPMWEYIQSAASETRVSNGLTAQANIATTLAAVENRYHVDGEILTAIWGLESAYGEIQGSNDIVRSLATLAWEGRRRDWAEAQLLAVADMLDRGYADRDELLGSWAGAMGQMQFIPTTYMSTAVDFDADGKRDIWSNIGDALGSAANLLKRGGWTDGEPVVVEVTLPSTFDFTIWDDRQPLSLSNWSAQGLDPVVGSWTDYDPDMQARLIVPAGASGPSFLAFDNYDALLTYNNSTAYALGVTYLAIALEGGPPIQSAWPEGNRPLNYDQARALQQGLNDLGYSTGVVDGIIGPNTRSALRRFQLAQGLPADGYAAQAAYDAVQAALQSD